MIKSSEKIYNSSEYHHLSQKNPHLSTKIEKHRISLLFITPPKVSQAHLWYLHSLITSCETLPPMCRNTPGVSLLLQDGRTERDGWGGDSHPCQGSSAFTHTHKRAEGPAALHHRSDSAPDVDPASANKALWWSYWVLLHSLSVPKKKRLTCRKFLSSQDQKKERGLEGKITRNESAGNSHYRLISTGGFQREALSSLMPKFCKRQSQELITCSLELLVVLWDLHSISSPWASSTMGNSLSSPLTPAAFLYISTWRQSLLRLPSMALAGTSELSRTKLTPVSIKQGLERRKWMDLLLKKPLQK